MLRLQCVCTQTSASIFIYFVLSPFRSQHTNIYTHKNYCIWLINSSSITYNYEGQILPNYTIKMNNYAVSKEVFQFTKGHSFSIFFTL